VTVSGPLVCTRCDRAPREGESGVAWSHARDPRPTGVTSRTPEQERGSVLCPECLRRHVRDVEARLDP
jgi:ribosomal protein L34E